MVKLEATKELTKKANVNRANVRRTLREMEEANEKVDPSFNVNLKNIEAEIAVLKQDQPRVLNLLTIAVNNLCENLKEAVERSID